ncbi:MAG TPA: aspartate kinase [Clostridia bacterium]|nr:aspartate kinase [Clostridia bacterium]
MIVSKFGGSSLADAKQIRKACAIMLGDRQRKIMVVSAPGIREDVVPDIKVTDLLIALVHEREFGRDGIKEQQALADRIQETARDLKLPPSVADHLTDELGKASANVDARDPASKASVLAMGELISAHLVAAYFNSLGVDARVLDPRDAGLVLAYQSGLTKILPETYDHLAHLSLTESMIIFPGFFGRTREGQTITFSRGGSDITGAILAAATNAKLYENWTDRDSVLAVNPELVEDARTLREMSYREMRELAYIGFSIIHPEALEPVIRNKIPIHIRNTNDPLATGTHIVEERTHIDSLLTGIAAADDFCTVNLRRVLINQEIGILSKILALFSELGINVHHVPTGIDSVSIVVKEMHFPLERELVLRHRLKSELGFDQVTVVRQLSIVMLVGEGMRDTVGVMARATTAMAKEQISIEMVLLDYFEISMIFMMRHYEKQRAVSALYREFFGESEEADKSAPRPPTI